MDATFGFLKHRLMREIVLILCIKLILLMTIKAIWFTAPTVPDNGAETMYQHVLGTSPASLRSEEKPR